MNELVEWIQAGIAEDEYLSGLTPQTQVQRIRGERLGREAARNRRILERHPIVTAGGGECCHGDHDDYLQKYPCDEVRDLASVYANRHGYRTEWGPR